MHSYIEVGNTCIELSEEEMMKIKGAGGEPGIDVLGFRPKTECIRPDAVIRRFVSYSHHDGEWVRSWLMPKLREAGLTVCVGPASLMVPGITRAASYVEKFSYCVQLVVYC